MSEPFLGQIMIVGFNFAPRGWAMCDGQLMNIAQNSALYSLLSITYGGDGRTTFALPDLRGRAPLDFGSGFKWGQKGNSETVTLTAAQMPGHTHALLGTTATADKGAVGSGANRGYATVPQSEPDDIIYGPAQSMVNLAPGVIASAGEGQAHSNIQPLLVLNFIIALMGIFPPRS
jgi:microcystin-dependent protein